MTVPPTAIDWRIGGLRTALPIAVHAVALWSTLELAGERPVAWILVAAVLASAAAEFLRWLRERRRAHTLTLVAGGIGIDSQVYDANRAWFGPHCTAVWLRAPRERRLLYVIHGEVTAAAHAAIRRHLKALKLE
jgi:hypothetical protein